MALCHSQVILMLSTDISITETTYNIRDTLPKFYPFLLGHLHICNCFMLSLFCSVQYIKDNETLHKCHDVLHKFLSPIA